jgi:hypothetical protein
MLHLPFRPLLSLIPATALFIALFGNLAAAAPAGASDGPEDFKIEIKGSAWLLDSGGTIQANGSPVDLVSDLGAHQQQPTFYGQLVVKPGRKHRIVVEGTPFRIDGLNTVNRTFTYQGQTFTVSQTVRSNADLNYFFTGYQYDILSGRLGHLGFSVGGAYLGTTGTIHAVELNTTSSKSITIGLPLAGAEFRVFPIPGHTIFEFDGGIRGMAVGDYGHYVHAQGNAGMALGPVTFQAGYRAVNADLHDTGTSPSGVNVRLKGPIFSLVCKW